MYVQTRGIVAQDVGLSPFELEEMAFEEKGESNFFAFCSITCEGARNRMTYDETRLVAAVEPSKDRRRRRQSYQWIARTGTGWDPLVADTMNRRRQSVGVDINRKGI